VIGGVSDFYIGDDMKLKQVLIKYPFQCDQIY
jgi:hypothetical protein